MVTTMVLVKLLLPVLAIIGYLSTWKASADNGFLMQLRAIHDSNLPMLPGTDYPVQQRWTGIAAIDHQLVLVVCFWWPVLDGSHPRLCLQAVHFAGQLLGIWTLVIVESFRVGNKWTLVSFATLVGLIMQGIDMAVAIPLYYLLQLLTSPTTAGSDSRSLAARKMYILVHPAELHVLPWAVLVGYVIPTVLICAPTPAYLSVTMKQNLIVLWQAFPLLVSICQLTFSVFSHTVDASFHSAEERNRIVLDALRSVFDLAIAFSILIHVATLAISFTSQLRPNIFGPIYKSQFDPKRVLVPTPFWTEASVNTIGEGVLRFLQWDEAIGCVATVAWAFAVRRMALAGKESVGSLFGTLLKTLSTALVGGPAAAALTLIRERDSMVLSELEVDDIKKVK